MLTICASSIKISAAITSMHDGGKKYNAVAGLFNFVLDAKPVKVSKSGE